MLTPERFTQLVAALPYKKVLPDAVYLHKETLATTSPQLYRFVCAVAQALKLPECEWDLVKLAKQDFRLSLLSYPTFFEEAYPSLKQSVTVDLAKLSHTITRYDNQASVSSTNWMTSADSRDLAALARRWVAC